MSQPRAPWATWLAGAAASHMFIAPHSSASTWPKVIQRSDSTGTHRGHRLGHQREHAARAGVEEQRLVGGDEELVEGEARPGVTSGTKVEIR